MSKNENYCKESEGSTTRIREKSFLEKHVGTILSVVASLALSVGTGLVAYGRGQEKAATVMQQCDACTKAIADLQNKQQEFCMLNGSVAQNRTEIAALKALTAIDHDSIIEMKADLKMVADWVRLQQRRNNNGNAGVN